MLNSFSTLQTRPLNYFPAKFGWPTGWLLAGLAFAFMFLVTPVTQFQLTPGPPGNNLDLLNTEVIVQRFGFTAQPDSGGQLVSAGAAIRATVFSYHPLTLSLDLQGGQGPLEININGVTVGKISGETLTGVYRFRFVPGEPAGYKKELYIQFNPTANSSPFLLKSLNLDLSEQWQPLLSRQSGSGLIILLAVVSLLAIASGLGRLYPWTGWVGLAAGLAGEILLVYRLVLYFQVGSGGALNAAVFWGGLGASLYLMLFIFVIAGFVLPVKNRYSVSGLVRPSLEVWQARRPFLAIALFLCLSNAFLTLLLFLVPVIQNNGFDSLARFWDGPEYLAIAYSLYDPDNPLLKIPHFASYSPLYWGAHFPLVPLAIRLFSPLFGYIGAMFVLNYLFTCGFAIALYRFLRDFGYSRNPLWLTLLGLFLPLRWLIYHSVGGSEPAALFFSILCLYQFKKGRYWQAGWWGAVVILARPNGFFLGIGLVLGLAWQALGQLRLNAPLSLTRRNLLLFSRRFNWKAAWALIPLPLALLAVFALYGWQTGDFLAYLHIPEDVKHLYPLPFLSLDINVGRSEGDFYYYGLEAAGLILLWRQKRYDLFWVGLALVLPTFFILHDDVLRYSLPAFPFVLLVPFAAVWESRPVRWLAVPALLAVLIYSWSQLNANQIDLANWREMLKYIS
jgi:hypothetical protein